MRTVQRTARNREATYGRKNPPFPFLFIVPLCDGELVGFLLLIGSPQRDLSRLDWGKRHAAIQDRCVIRINFEHVWGLWA